MEASSPRIERRRVRTTAAILDAAESLLVERRIRAATVDAIAERADVAVATLYAHFDGKAGVMHALAERAVERNAVVLDEALAIPGTAPERLASLARAYLAFHLANPSALRVLAAGDLPGRDQIDAQLDALVRRVAGVVEQGIADGEVRADVDPLRVARFVWGAWNGAVALQARGAISRAELQRTLDDGLAVLTAGLEPRI
jgi:AcrR family transcriptional regulator